MVDPVVPSASLSYELLRDTLRISGPDRKSWLDGLVTCSVAPVAPGTAAYGLLLTKQGKIVTDLFLLDDGNVLFMGVAPGRGEVVRELLDRYLVMEDAELESPIPAPAWRFASAPDVLHGASAHGTLTLGTLQGQVAISPAGSQPGVQADADQLARLWARHGLGTFGVDFGERDNPHEASLDRVAISWTKGCYLGQEVVCMQDMRGKVKRRLVALEAHSASSELVGKPVHEVHGAAVAGLVSSVHHEPSGAALLLASIMTPALESQAGLTVEGVPVRRVEGAVSPGAPAS